MLFEMKKRENIYLDVCCMCRPFDDLAQDRVRREADAVKEILLRIGKGEWSWVGSDVMMFEIGEITEQDLQLDIALMIRDVSRVVVPGDAERSRAAVLRGLGFKDVDSLHLACAESAVVDVFLTTDDVLLKRAKRHADAVKVKVRNPLNWLAEVLL